MVNVNTKGHKSDPLTLGARKKRAEELLREGKETQLIMDTLRHEFNGVAIGAGTLTEIKKNILKMELRQSRKNKKQLSMPFEQNTTRQLSKAAQFAVEVAAAGGRIQMDLNSEKLEISFR